MYRYTYHWDSFEAILAASLMYLVLSAKCNSFFVQGFGGIQRQYIIEVIKIVDLKNVFW